MLLNKLVFIWMLTLKGLRGGTVNYRSGVVAKGFFVIGTLSYAVLQRFVPLD